MQNQDFNNCQDTKAAVFFTEPLLHKELLPVREIDNNSCYKNRGL